MEQVFNLFLVSVDPCCDLELKSSYPFFSYDSLAHKKYTNILTLVLNGLTGSNDIAWMWDGHFLRIHSTSHCDFDHKESDQNCNTTPAHNDVSS